MSQASVVKLVRSPNLPFMVGYFDVYIDGYRLGIIGSGKEARFEVEPGDHNVQIRYGVSKSKIVNLSVDAGAIAAIECGGGKTAFFFLLVALAHLSFAQHASKELSWFATFMVLIYGFALAIQSVIPGQYIFCRLAK